MRPPVGQHSQSQQSGGAEVQEVVRAVQGELVQLRVARKDADDADDNVRKGNEQVGGAGG